MKQTVTFLVAALALLGTPVRAQQPAPPVLSSPPTAPAPAAPVPTTPAAAPAANDPYVLGRTYRVETMQGTSFTAALVSISLTTLEFEAPELGRIKLERAQIRRADLQGGAPVGVAARPGYYDIGNGNRLFFAPTARGLRKGEATLQSVNLFLVGLNYGVSNNFSIGGYLSVVPGLAITDQFLAITPKLSFPISEKLHAGAGLLYIRVPTFDSDSNFGAGIGYGALTYGGADDNLTLGLGYGFVQGGDANEVGTTPIVQIGGQKRLSRRVSLVSENYLIAESEAGMFGLYGIKINWRRTSLGLGAAYVYTFGYEETSSYTSYPGTGPPVTVTQKNKVPASGGSTYILPVYYDFTFRFGKVK